MERERFYRQWVRSDGLVTFEVRIKETDLYISSERSLEEEAKASVNRQRSAIERYSRKNARFVTSLVPIPAEGDEQLDPIVAVMLEASRKAGVGPMAAVAGAIAECVGRDLLQFSREVIVENGGDIFLKTRTKKKLGIYAGNSPLSGRLVFELDPDERGWGVATSSGTVGHSLSFGKADAAVIIAHDTALADAVATAAGNRVRDKLDLEGPIDFAKTIEGITGAVIIMGDRMATWGSVRFTEDLK